MLVTPGLFERGWLPGWLDRGTLEGAPPSVPGLRLNLVSAAVGRRMAISGWRLRDGPHGQRATRYAAPPGAVYFFELLNGPLTGDQWRRLWLASIADLGSDRHNGYGLALPGIW
jgi:CRISPR-associated protein Cmr3